MGSSRKAEEHQNLPGPHAGAQNNDLRLTQREHELTPCQYRNEFQRDYTRILHSTAFRRLRHKTQVFISPNNDHICTRMEHSLYVASIADTIARELRLNLDLVRAIAIGHDLGHAPFGHAGERALHKLVPKGEGGFSHELHSLRIVDHLESPYKAHPGLNLTFAVRDGIACHCGEQFETILSPDRGKTPSDLNTMVRGKAMPATLEGCVVRWADKVAYLGRDIDDAHIVGLVSWDDVPKSVVKYLGKTNREIIHALICDLIHNSDVRNDCIGVSREIAHALEELKTFNTENIYNSRQNERSLSAIKMATTLLYRQVIEKMQLAKNSGEPDSVLEGHSLEHTPHTTQVMLEFLKKDARHHWEKSKPWRLAIDFIAGMTDTFFIRALNEYFVPTPLT
jgi:dGTPase